MYLRGEWASNPQEKIPILTRKATKIALHALASRVPAKGNCIEAFPNFPRDAPWWKGKVSISILLKGEEQVVYSIYLINQHMVGEILQVFMEGILSNRGWYDNKSIAMAAAILYYKKTEWEHTESVLGEKLAKADIEIEALCPALTLLGDFVKETNYIGLVHLITGLPTAMQLFLNFKQHAIQHISLDLAWKIDSLLIEYIQISLIIQYAKSNPDLDSLKRARKLAIEAVKRPLANKQ